MAFIPFKSSTVHKISLVNFYLNVFQWNTKNFQHAECNELVAEKSKKKLPQETCGSMEEDGLNPELTRRGAMIELLEDLPFRQILRTI